MRMVAIALAGSVLVCALGVMQACSRGGNKTQAELDAHRFALNIGLVNPHASCVDVDLNNDGYVSCTLTSDNHPEPMALDCAASNPLYWWGCSQQRGCRLTRLGVQAP